MDQEVRSYCKEHCDSDIVKILVNMWWRWHLYFSFPEELMIPCLWFISYWNPIRLHFILCAGQGSITLVVFHLSFPQSLTCFSWSSYSSLLGPVPPFHTYKCIFSHSSFPCYTSTSMSLHTFTSAPRFHPLLVLHPYAFLSGNFFWCLSSKL